MRHSLPVARDGRYCREMATHVPPGPFPLNTHVPLDTHVPSKHTDTLSRYVSGITLF